METKITSHACTADLIFFIISVGAILQEKHILVMDLKKITLFCHLKQQFL
jgi:hypothetical protein